MTPARVPREGPDEPTDGDGDGRPAPPERKALLLRLDPAVHAALARWASDEVRSVNGQLDHLLRRALAEAGRLPRGVREPRGPGRPSAG